MATGTGKTRTTIALVDALMRAGYVKRTLFLVDRIALRDQAVDAFKEHLPDEPLWPKFGENEIAKDRRVYVSTYPTMLNIIRDENTPLSSHFFDLIIVDESHRSIYNTYQEIFDYFDTIRVGLTATPTNVIDHNTFELFDCEDGIPTFAFSYEEAVTHEPPYLCNFQVMKVKTKFQDEGINKRTISLEDQKRLILEGKEVEEINFEGTDIERTVINKGTNETIVRTYMDECIKDDDGVLPAKTIFFCSTKRHARRMEELFDELYPEYAGELAKVMVSDDPRVYGKGGLLDQFKNKNLPRVAISVDMLDTGIDVRELTNLVFAKPVYSYTKFWQMIGRGTRLLDPSKPKPWCTKKDKFLILDCWDNFEYFKLKPEGKEPISQTPLPVKLFEIRLAKIKAALNIDETIAHKEIAKLRVQIAQLPENSIVIKEAQNDLDHLDETFWQELSSQKLEFLGTKIQPLCKTIVGVDYKAMRFEKDVLEASKALLENDQPSYEKLKAKIVAQVEELPLTINIVNKEEQLIKQALGNHFWATATDEKLDTMGERLAHLMQYREPLTQPEGQTKLNLRDIVKEKEFVEFGPEHESVSISKYKEMVEIKIAELIKQNSILQKLKAGETITQEESEALALTLHDEDPHITLDLLRKVYRHQKAPFIKLIRHILGIERLESFPESVSKAIDKFIVQHSTLTTKQLEFLSLLREYIIAQGDIQKRDLIQAPFTVLHPSGIRGIFSPQEIDEIIELTKELVA